MMEQNDTLNIEICNLVMHIPSNPDSNSLWIYLMMDQNISGPLHHPCCMRFTYWSIFPFIIRKCYAVLLMVFSGLYSETLWLQCNKKNAMCFLIFFTAFTILCKPRFTDQRGVCCLEDQAVLKKINSARFLKKKSMQLQAVSG